MDEHTFMVNRERAVDYLNSLDKVILYLFIDLPASFTFCVFETFFISTFSRQIHTTAKVGCRSVYILQQHV